MNARGTDVSRYETPINFALGRERGLRFAIARATVGDYYADATFRTNWDGYKNEGVLTSAYLVVAPKDPSLSRRISAQAHLDKFFNTVSGLRSDLRWVIDCELARGESKEYITQLNKDIVTGIHQGTGKYPIVYTRQTWWDVYVNHDPLWANCDLFPARYASWLTSPWSDGACRFRDWTDWKFWQYTDKGDGVYYGFTGDGDMDWFNGDEEALYAYAGLSNPLTLEEKVEVLWREAKLHGWNMNK